MWFGAAALVWSGAATTLVGDGVCTVRDASCVMCKAGMYTFDKLHNCSKVWAGVDWLLTFRWGQWS
jgi:hypothetical protein